MQSKQQIKQLIKTLEHAGSPISISIYAPLDYDSPDALTSNTIRIKNIISEIKRIHDSSDSFRVESIQEHLRPLEDLLDSRSTLWQRSAKSLAVFVNNNFVQYQFLPVEQSSQQVVVSNNFLLEPLRRVIQDNPSFYVLSASHDQVKLFYGDKFHLEPVELDSLPKKSAEETLGIDEYPQSIQYHPATTPAAKAGTGKYSKQFHGQYNAVEVDRNIMKKYFRAVNNAVSNHLRGKKVPLIFAGVNYLFPLYEQVNSYKHLKKKHINGNFQHTRSQELHKRALAVI